MEQNTEMPFEKNYEYLIMLLNEYLDPSKEDDGECYIKVLRSSNRSAQAAMFLTELPKLAAENERLKRLLHDLTPQGSEFYNDPEYCAKWIRENRFETEKQLKTIIVEKKAENESLKARNDVLANLLKAYVNMVGNTGYSIAKEQATFLFQQANEVFNQ